jgi:hypothetical protein
MPLSTRRRSVAYWKQLPLDRSEPKAYLRVPPLPWQSSRLVRPPTIRQLLFVDSVHPSSQRARSFQRGEILRERQPPKNKSPGLVRFLRARPSCIAHDHSQDRWNLLVRGFDHSDGLMHERCPCGRAGQMTSVHFLVSVAQGDRWARQPQANSWDPLRSHQKNLRLVAFYTKDADRQGPSSHR